MRFQKYAFPLSSKTHRSIPVRTTVLMRLRLSIHTNAFSFENAYISMRSGLPSHYTNTLAERLNQKRIGIETFLKGDQNENAYISYYCGRSKAHRNENYDS